MRLEDGVPGRIVNSRGEEGEESRDVTGKREYNVFTGCNSISLKYCL